ncbi:MAG: M20 family metallo-hydrolase [Methanobacteriota archaeon]|nr:MAG: M20 family metallo-hydrolase [Euryarchaeota archaeon]
MTLQSVLERIDSSKEEMVNSLIEMCKIPSIHPDSGGDGETERAKFLTELCGKLGLPVRSVDAPDEKVSSGVRPNMLVELEGKQDKMVWIVSHSDIVPAGNLKHWDTDPFDPVVKDGKIFGRGVEDNGQSLIRSLYALWAVKEEGGKPDVGCGLALVADEEVGSRLGIQYLLTKDIFNPGDLILVPDFSSSAGTDVEIAEKNILWMRITTEGRQSHASLPHKGINALRAGAELLLMIDKELHDRYTGKNEIFDPPTSTFEPTKKNSNVPNVNTVPGKDVFYFDCRLLPEFHPEEIRTTVRTLADQIEQKRKVKIKIDIIQEEMSPATSEDSEFVVKLKNAI